ncbi:MAG TPA: histidine--tRNA ligase [Candidatus Saccharimonadales bacterium]|nr:histidine--tRNA ligase [Candidatus Saccharimonadales bacterium]
MALSTQPYKGTRDFYPEDMRLRNWMFGKWREACERFGYEEYDGPILEPLELFASKTSDEIVNDQTYAFTDRGGRQVVMRPEMTPTVSRMVAARRQELAYPLRLYSIPNCFRYERPQKGRLREFWQLNADLFGVASIEADIEIIKLADSIMRSFGAKPAMYEIVISSRKLITEMFDELELPEPNRKTLLSLIDKKEKTEAAQWEKLFFDVLDRPKAEKLLAYLKEETVPEDVKTVKDSLKNSGIENVRFNRYLARGFEYYTDIVFEVFDKNPENNRSMYGGGRYDGLVGNLGVEPISSVGCAMGDATLLEFLKSNQLLPELKIMTDIYLIPVGDVLGQAEKIADELREMGANVAVDSSGNKLDKQIRSAAKKGVRYALFIGDKELKDEQYALKDLVTGNEERKSLQRIVSTVKDYRKQ